MSVLPLMLIARAGAKLCPRFDYASANAKLRSRVDYASANARLRSRVDYASANARLRPRVYYSKGSSPFQPFFILAFLLGSSLLLNAQNLYTKTFGDPQNSAIVFLHGGPGYNCANFEATTARPLAAAGFFVLVYDRRGEGRSSGEDVAFTYKETLNDLNDLLKKYKIKKAALIGHSFGGVVATLFARKYPNKVSAVVLAASPVVFQETFRTILKKSKSLYQSQKDSINLNYIRLLENMDSKSIEYSSYCFTHAMQNRFYSPKEPTEEAKLIYAAFRADTLLKYASQLTSRAPQAFWEHEQYTSIDLRPELEKLLAAKVPVYGIYGKDDGLFSVEQVMELQNLIGADRLIYFDQCAHNAFMDQQSAFIEALRKWVK